MYISDAVGRTKDVLEVNIFIYV